MHYRFCTSCNRWANCRLLFEEAGEISRIRIAGRFNVSYFQIRFKTGCISVQTKGFRDYSKVEFTIGTKAFVAEPRISTAGVLLQ